MALGNPDPDLLNRDTQHSTAMISTSYKSSNSLKPFGQYFTLLVNILIVSLVCSGVAGALNIASNNDTPIRNKDIQAVLAMIGACALSFFIIKGLTDIEAGSKKQKLELLKISKDKLLDIEEMFGSMDAGQKLVLVGEIFSTLAILANLAQLATSLYDNHAASASKITTEAQSLVISTLTTCANLLGFILFNILGMRNTKIQENLTAILFSANNNKFESEDLSSTGSKKKLQSNRASDAIAETSASSNNTIPFAAGTGIAVNSSTTDTMAVTTNTSGIG